MSNLIRKIRISIKIYMKYKTTWKKPCSLADQTKSKKKWTERKKQNYKDNTKKPIKSVKNTSMYSESKDSEPKQNEKNY